MALTWGYLFNGYLMTDRMLVCLLRLRRTDNRPGGPIGNGTAYSADSRCHPMVPPNECRCERCYIFRICTSAELMSSCCSHYCGRPRRLRPMLLLCQAT